VATAVYEAIKAAKTEKKKRLKGYKVRFSPGFYAKFDGDSWSMVFDSKVPILTREEALRLVALIEAGNHYDFKQYPKLRAVYRKAK
jgi:hypothetical protein